MARRRFFSIRRAGALALLGLSACQRCSSHAERARPDPDDERLVRADGTWVVPGLERLAHKPLLVLVDSDAWSGSLEGLPVVTIYEDGLTITCRLGVLEAEILEGTTADPIALARRIAAEISGLAPHIKISGATDQPMVTVFARSGEAWRSVTVVGFRGGESVPAQTAEPPEAFVAAYRTLAEIRPRDAHPFPKRDFIVTLHEDSVPSRAPSAWPADVPPPPPGLVPDERYVGKPRVYELHGDAGSSLKTFARSIQGYGVRTPAGERVNIGSVHVAIPSVAYLESLYYCRTWKLEPFHVCDRRLPGRP